MSQQYEYQNVYLGLGSNIGDTEKNLKLALENIDLRVGEIVSVSGFYKTDPVGFDSDHSFLNAVCHIRTILDPLEVLESTQVIEREMGRRSKSVNNVYADRIIDIDVLLYNDCIIEYPHLVIPHPHLHERSFVLDPLSEIAPLVIHPVLNETISELKHKLDIRENQK